ncbi:MAG: beta-galactosidase, partial [Lentisphaerota bacterium]
MSKKTLMAMLACILVTSLNSFAELQGFIKMRDGYFYNDATDKPWVPHGIAYQTWNRPLGVWQSKDQVDYDLDEMVKMGANSIRVDFVWQHIEEEGDNQWKWENYDYLVQAAEARGLRMFALIGYQWPPNWFPDEWYTMHPPETDAEGIVHTNRWQSDIINYEHPLARAQYAEWFQNVCSRYKDSKAIVGWIIGNESGYLGLWSGLLDGYDPQSEQAFRDWCVTKYGTIANVNLAWGSEYGSFSNIVFVDQYRAYGEDGAEWSDMVQWREDSIGSFTALGAVAAKTADTNHLISYSTVGMQWGEEDWRYHAEDRGKITKACAAASAPIDFFSVNNYPWSVLGHESQNGQWGISYTKKVAGVPVLYSETGFTSSETMWPGMNELRQGPLIRNALWESLEAGAIGTHIFAWHDRPYITDREKGFGILYANRAIKPAFWVSRNAYMLMDQVDIHSLLANSKDPKPDIAFLWTDANDSQYNRYECEMQQIAGALERLGYEPNFLDLNDLAAGVYTNYKLIILPRNMRVEDAVPGSGGKTVLDFLRTVVIPAGIHVMATADLPGMQDVYGKPRAAFVDENKALFGIDPSNTGGYEAPQRRREYVSWYWQKMHVLFNSNAVGPVAGGYEYEPQVWKFSDEIKVTNGGVMWAEMEGSLNKGFEDSATNPAGWNAWGNWELISTWNWALAGTNMIHLWGDSGVWQDVQVVPFGRYSVSTYLRSNNDDPLKGGAYASLAIEWLDQNWNTITNVESERLMSATPGETWVRYDVDAIAPSNAWTARRIIRSNIAPYGPNLLANGALTGSGTAPTSWSAWNDGNNDPDTNTCRSSGNAWAFWWDSGIWQDLSKSINTGNVLKFGGYFYQPANDALTNGSKYGVIELELYNGASRVGVYSASPVVHGASASNAWIYTEGAVTSPVVCDRARVIVRCNGSGDGRFLADDIFLAEANPSGSVYVDNYHLSPAVVVKNHGPAKSAIFLYSAGDFKPDGDESKDPDVLPWKWRYDVFGAMVRDYFGIQPKLRVTGSNEYLCLAEYRTCADGSTLWQVKNYQYDTNQPNGGPALSFTLTSSLFTGKTVRAFEQSKIIEKNSDGTINLMLDPDGMEMLHVYAETTNLPVLQISDTPSLIHSFGDKGYVMTVKFDLTGFSGLTLKLALMEDGDNGDGVTNEILEVVGVPVSGMASTNIYMWIPDANTMDPDKFSTIDGGKYKFEVWLEDAASNRVGDVLSQTTQLNWGINPLTPMPTNLVKGQSISVPVEWENLYEYLVWQNTPMTRNDSFPARVGLFRSTKTEAQFPGHLDRVNQVCDWLESMDYSAGNPLDISFDDVTVSVNMDTNVVQAGPRDVFTDEMETGVNGWSATGLWHLTTNLSASATTSWGYNNNVNYNTGVANSGDLITPWINLTGDSGAILSFQSWYETEDTGNSWDKKRVYLSTDGTNWTQLLQISGPNKQWTVHSLDIGTYLGSQVKIRFSFDTVDATLNNYKGWFIDNLKVTTVAGDLDNLFIDDMESTTNWTASGMWRSATNRSVSGQRSYVYNNGANFDNGARNSGSLVSPWIDLSSAASASLTFKSWYRTEDAGPIWDRKTVLVTMDGTNWTQVLQVSGLSQQWTAQSVDLGVYVGQRVRVKFSFDTIDPINNRYEGWYVDDVRVSTLSGTGYAVFSDNAENGLNGWTADGLWRLAEDFSSSPDHSWAYNNGVNYNTGARTMGSLVSPWIDLSSAASATLSFRSWYETENTGTAWDKKQVYVSLDGAQWSQVLQVSGPMRHWATLSCDLSAFAGHSIRLKFVFDSMDRLFNGFRGWYVDDIDIKIVGTDLLFADSFNAGAYSAWTRAAGAGNWAVQTNALRSWRIGNDDNILFAGSSAWSNYQASVNIRYNTQDEYYDDAELYLRYKDRNNFVKVGIKNFFGAWRLKYTVRFNTNNIAQGWICEFPKTNRPVEGVWYKLSVQADGSDYTVFFDDKEVGGFTETNLLTGKIGIGCRAAQLGIWEPQKGYYFIDDDEYSYYSPKEGELITAAKPLNLDWGYLDTFFQTLILPGTYVMSDIEASNVVTWLNMGYYNLIATDGGVAMRNETGASDLGRIESLFGVAPSVVTNYSPTRAVIGTNDHYVTLDYSSGDELSSSGSSMIWPVVQGGRALATMDNGASSAPALIVNVNTNDPFSPRHVFCFNFGVDKLNQLTGSYSVLARRAFEWARGQAHKVRVQLKYTMDPNDPDVDLTLKTWDQWVLGGSGTNLLNIVIPESNIMTGTNLYWVFYTYPWDGTNAWTTHDGFYTSGNDGPNGKKVTLPGLGLQILGAPYDVFGGRSWDMWVAYNTCGRPLSVVYGVKDKDNLLMEDNFNDGNFNGWSRSPASNNQWSVISTGSLRAVGNGYSMLMKDGLDLSDRNITMEYDVRFDGAGGLPGDGGLIYRGYPLYINPQGIWWSTDNPLTFNSPSNFSGVVTNADGSLSYVVTGSIYVYIGPPGLSTGAWHHVSVSIRDGATNPVSDIYVDGSAVIMAQPLPGTNWTSASMGFLSPYTNRTCWIDNVRVVDEQYTMSTGWVNGVFVPTNDAQPTFLGFVGDFDPNMWEFEGTTLGGKYEWYIAFKGEGVHGEQGVNVNFSPRLMVE